jgi:hypothetical protein
VGGEGGEEAGEQQIRVPGDPCFSSPRLLFRCVSGRGFDKNSALGSAVQGLIFIKHGLCYAFYATG